MPRNAVLLAVPAALVVTILVGFHDLSRRSLWDDEATTVWFARMPAAEIWRTRDENLSPFYYLGVRAWRGALGEDEVSLRGLSALGRVLGLFAIVALGAATMGARGAAVLAFLYVVSPPALLYGRELRPYPFVFAFACGGLACLWHAGTTGRVRWAVAAGLALGLALMTQYTTLLLLGGLFAAHLLPSLRPRRWALGVALGVVLLTVLPWAGVFAENLGNLLSAATGPEQVPIPFGPFGKAGYALFVLVLGETVLPWRWAVSAPAALGSAVLCVLGWRALADRRGLRVFLVVPLALSVAALSFTMKAGPRYVFLLLPCLLALFAAGALGGAPAWLRAAALAAVAVPSALSQWNVFEGREYHNMAMVEPSREVAQDLRKWFERGDLLVYTAESKPLLYYYLEGLAEPRFLDWDGEARLNRESGSETFEEFLAASKGRTVWWIERSAGYVPQAGRLAERARELQEALKRRGSGSVEWPFGEDPDAEAKRRWIRKEFLEYRIVLRRFDP
ncbi:MAG: glycosyltransferase family 39 protein [Planctomycetota bacterium]